MAVSFIGHNSAASTSVTVPAHQAGDLIVIFAYRTTTTAPTLASGYTSLKAVSGNSNSLQVGYKIATSTSDTSGTWTNATLVHVAVYRSSVGGVYAGVNTAQTNAASSSTTIAALGTFINTSGSSWVVAFAGSKQATSQGTPSGLTSRGTQTATSADSIVADTNGGVSSFSSHTSANGSSVVSASAAVEIMESPSFSTFSDPMTASTQNTTLWGGNFGTLSWSPNGFTITNPSSYTGYGGETTNYTYNLTGAYISTNITNIGNQALTSLETVPLQIDQGSNTNRLFWYINQNNVSAQKTVAGTSTTIGSSATFSSLGSPTWFRIRESSGTIYWDYSSDGSTWTNFQSTTTPITITDLHISPSLGTYNAEASSTSGFWVSFTGGSSSVAMGTLQDNFSTDDHATLWPNAYTSSSTWAVTGGQLVITLANNVAGTNYSGWSTSPNTYNLTGSHAFVQVPNPTTVTGTQVLLKLSIDSNNILYFQITGTTLSAVKVVAGTQTTISSTTYNSTNHKWLKIRESGGTTYWDTSPDSATWTNFTSTLNPITVTSLIAEISAGTYQATVSPGTVAFDNFNIYSSSLSATLSFSGSVAKKTSRSLSGSLGFSGSVVKQTRRPLTAALSFVGSLAKRTSRAFSAALSFAGALAAGHIFTKALTAALSFSGSLSRSTHKKLTGSLSFSGSISKVAYKTLSGALSFAGSINRQTNKVLVASLSFVGSLVPSLKRSFLRLLSLVFNKPQPIELTMTQPKPLSYSIVVPGPISVNISLSLPISLSVNVPGIIPISAANDGPISLNFIVPVPIDIIVGQS